MGIVAALGSSWGTLAALGPLASHLMVSLVFRGGTLISVRDCFLSGLVRTFIFVLLWRCVGPGWSPLDSLGLLLGMPLGILFVLGTAVGCACCLCVSMCFPLLSRLGPLVLPVALVGALEGPWGGSPGSVTNTATALGSWLHWLWAFRGCPWGFSSHLVAVF